MSSETESDKHEVTKSNDVKSISPMAMNENNSGKNKNEKIIRTPITSKIPVELKEIQPKSYTPHTPVSFIPQQYVSTEPKRNVINEVTPPAFITPTAVAPKKKIAFTVEDYLKSLAGTQH